MSLKKQNRFLGVSTLLGAAFSFPWFGVLARIVGLDLPLFFQTGIRSLVASLIFFVLIVLGSKWNAFPFKAWTWIIIRSSFGLLAAITFFVSVNALPIGTVYFIVYSGSTIAGFMIGRLLFSEKITKIKWISLALALSGLFLIYSLDISGNLVYLLLSFAAGVFAALWNTLHRKLPENLDPSQISFLDNGFLVLLAIPISIVLKENWLFPSLEPSWLANYAYGVLQVITGILVVIGFRNVEAQLGSLVMLTQVVFASLLGFLLYQEVISPITFIGGILILSGVALPEIFAAKNKT